MKTEYYLSFDKNLLSVMSDDEYMIFYKGLIDEIRHHNYLYYSQNQSIITDAEYDKLFDLLGYCEGLYKEKILFDSPTQSLSDQLNIQTEFSKANHDTPLLSLQKAYTAEDLNDRNDSNIKNLIKMGALLSDDGQMTLSEDVSDDYNSLKNNIEGQPKNNQTSENSSDKSSANFQIQYIIEPKYDGISIELIYIDGAFVQAVTRGDGQVGEDITINVMTIPSVPKKLLGEHIGKRRFRGEIMMTKTEFERINEERGVLGELLFANPRNAASGSVKQLDPNVTARRNLICYVYEEL